MSATDHTYERILAYLKGLLSNRQRHDLEREMMHDAFDEEAFEGLNHLTADELEHDSSVLLNRLDKRMQPGRRRNMPLLLRIAATVVLLAGIGTVLYFIFRTPSESLITQEITREKPLKPPETAASSPTDQQTSTHETEAGVDSRTISGIKQEIPEIDKIPEQRSEEASPMVENLKSATAKEFASESAIMNTASERQKSAAPRSSTDGISTTGLLTGRIVGSDGEALPGVAVREEGTDRGTVTDINGRFSIKTTDSNSMLVINYIGYKSLEMNAREITGRDIIMQEDLMALEEVVVVGYGTQKKKDETGAVSVLEADEISPGREGMPYDFIKPVPPGGSLKAFKNWVVEKLDYSKYGEFSGKYRIQVTLTVKADGSLTDIETTANDPALITEDIKGIIAQSSRWQPALKNKIPIEAQIVIRFVIEVE